MLLKWFSWSLPLLLALGQARADPPVVSNLSPQFKIGPGISAVSPSLGMVKSSLKPQFTIGTHLGNHRPTVLARI